MHVQLSGGSIRQKLGKHVLILAVSFSFAFSNQAKAETTAKMCLNQSEDKELVAAPPTDFSLLFGFENRVPAAFPVGSQEDILKTWLSKAGFIFNGLSMDDTAFADEPDENARFKKRLKDNEYVNLSILSWRTPCGRMVFSIGWGSDECGLIDEIHADVEYCQFDLP